MEKGAGISGSRTTGSTGVERGLVCRSQGEDQPLQTVHTEESTSVELRVGVTVREVGVHLWLGALGESSAPNIGPLQLHMCT